ncbi:MAG: hypothetical protein L0Z62_14065 [Gemmataceae bacterium]|nr:hypothetical protein [Gemmataceae bacterium]
MSDQWERTSVRGDVGSGGTTSTHTMVSKDGDVKEVCVHSGTPEYESRQVGEAIKEGNFKK